MSSFKDFSWKSFLSLLIGFLIGVGLYFLLKFAYYNGGFATRFADQNSSSLATFTQFTGAVSTVFYQSGDVLAYDLHEWKHEFDEFDVENSDSYWDDLYNFFEMRIDLSSKYGLNDKEKFREYFEEIYKKSEIERMQSIVNH
ncbi:MAG TPA: hypothetical protein PKV16_02590 [Caldisericia bacterium]|nr:hypothetical protein [Caldisericia bacterium]HPF48201.1 hypothetical protein [Caldisericia bacterium]HPI83863.1 hypothetical protein [Caldisericia bacterium]HPQ92654.1 hypothetical protein [Caldisericia bacterium]HRV74248.1 hypothetical protein [Caldisericia bacterium]